MTVQLHTTCSAPPLMCSGYSPALKLAAASTFRMGIPPRQHRPASPLRCTQRAAASPKQQPRQVGLWRRLCKERAWMPWRVRWCGCWWRCRCGIRRSSCSCPGGGRRRRGLLLRPSEEHWTHLGCCTMRCVPPITGPWPPRKSSRWCMRPVVCRGQCNESHITTATVSEDCVDY